MRTIYKYTIDPMKDSGPLTVRLPGDSMTLTVQEQNELLAIWVELDPDALARGTCLFERTWTVVGTGHPFENIGSYVGTVQFFEGRLVLHVYER